MKKGTLGRSSLEVSSLGFGCLDRQEAISLVREAFENLGAAALELIDDDRRQTKDALAQVQVQGDRHPAHLAALVAR